MSALRMTLTVLATGLAEAVARDYAEAPAGVDKYRAYDLSTGKFGIYVQHWLRDVGVELERYDKEVAAKAEAILRLSTELGDSRRESFDRGVAAGKSSTIDDKPVADLRVYDEVDRTTGVTHRVHDARARRGIKFKPGKNYPLFLKPEGLVGGGL